MTKPTTARVQFGLLLLIGAIATTLSILAVGGVSFIAAVLARRS